MSEKAVVHNVCMYIWMCIGTANIGCFKSFLMFVWMKYGVYVQIIAYCYSRFCYFMCVFMPVHVICC